MKELARAIERVAAALRRRPQLGLHDDAPATARWQHGTRVVTRHANGTELPTDMAQEFGGSGDQVTPGWMFRAGMASCMATTVAMLAAAEGIELSALEVRTSSRSDTRGLIGMPGEDGAPVFAGPDRIEMQVRIAAPGVDPERLRALVEKSRRCAPVPSAVESPVPVALRIEIDTPDHTRS